MRQATVVLLNFCCVAHLYVQSNIQNSSSVVIPKVSPRGFAQMLAAKTSVGQRPPLSLTLISSAALALELVVPIPTFCPKPLNDNSKAKAKNAIFINLSFEKLPASCFKIVRAARL